MAGILGASQNEMMISVGSKSDTAGVDKSKKSVDDLSNSTDKASASSSRFTGVIKAAQVAVIALGAAITAGGIAAVKSAADLQQTSKSFEVLTGDVKVANDLFAQLATYANTTPFEFPEIAKAGQTLLGFGIQAKDVFNRVQMLGDIAAATGADFSSLALVFGQVNATGKLMGQDALQLINNRIPVYNILAKEMGIRTGDVKKKMEEGVITTEIFNKALQKVTEEGGFAFKGVDTLAQSFNGRLSTLSDTVLDFGRNLIGVRIDPKLGLAIESGGIFDRLSGFILKASESLGDLTPVLSRGIKQLLNFGDTIAGIGADIFDYLKPGLIDLKNAIGKDLFGAMADVVRSPFAQFIGNALVVALKGAVWGTTEFIKILASVIKQLSEGTSMLIGITTAIIGYKATVGAITTATNLWQAAQLALNAAMKLNPIGLLIGATAGIVAGFISATGQTDFYRSATERLTQAQKAARDAALALKDAEINLEDARLARQGSDIAVQRAEERLTELRKSGTASALDLKEAEYNLAVAKDTAAKAADREKKAIEGVTKAKREDLKAKDDVIRAEQSVANAVGNTANKYKNLADQINAANKAAKQGDIAKNINALTSVPGTGLGSQTGLQRRATGGDVGGGRPYIWGENEPEVFVSHSAGRVYTQQQLRGNGMSTSYDNSKKVSIATVNVYPQTYEAGRGVFDMLNSDAILAGKNMTVNEGI